MSEAKLTEADFNGWRFNRDAVHFNGGAKFFGWGHRCVDNPRLLVIDKYFKKDRSTTRSYLIDSSFPCETLAEALAALDKPPTMTADERVILSAVPAEGWFKPESRTPFIALVAKGYAEKRSDENGIMFRVTETGRRALSKAGE